MKLPTLFVAHGAPTLAVEPTPAHRFLRGLGAQLPRPRAVLMVSAHWEASRPTVNTVSQPRTIHDFYGFPEALYQIRYPAPGAPVVAQRVVELLDAAGWRAGIDAERGLDHGAWVPASLMWPEATLPMLQLSLIAGGSAADHWRLGQALAPLRDEGVLVVGSGGTTHNLREFRGQPVAALPPDWVVEFADWIADGLTDGDPKRLLAWASHPLGRRNHPTAEHLMPLFVAAGAGGSTAAPLYRGYEYGILAMEAWQFH